MVLRRHRTRIRWNNAYKGHYAVQGHRFFTGRKLICDFL